MMGLRDVLSAAWRWLNEPLVPTAAPATPVRESFSPLGLAGLGNDPDANLTADQGGSRYYRRLTSRVDRDLPTLTDEQARQIAAWLWDFNPIAKRALESVRDYILGEGVTVTLNREQEDTNKPPPEQTIIDEFWTGPFNRMDRWLDDYVLELALFGEQCWTVAVNPANGAVALDYIDSASIKAVIMDRKRPKEAAEIQLKSELGGNDGPRYKVIRPDLEADSPTYGLLMGVRTNKDGTPRDTFQRHQDGPREQYAGSCFFWAINKPISATRGRSDLLSIADMIDGVDKLLINEIDRQELMKAFIWDVTLTGMSEDDIAAYAASQSAPKPGSVRFHNDKAVWKAESPRFGSYDFSRVIETITSFIATGAGLPKTWLNETETTNRATAAELSEPVFKFLTKRQGYVREMIVDVVTFALDQAELVGMVPRRGRSSTGIPEAWPLTVQFPELRPKDMTSGSKALADGATALATLRAEGLVDEEAAIDAAMLMLKSDIGLDIDGEAMRERLKVEKAERERQQAEMQRQQAETGANGNGKPPGGRLAVVARGGD